MAHPISDIRDRIPEYGEAVPVHRRGVAPKLNASEGIYNGTPNGEDIARIQMMKGSPAEADDWRVYSFNAFDNSINLYHEIFSPSIVAQYADRIAGKSFLLNHDMGHIESSQALVLDARVYQLDTLQEEARADLPNYTASKANVEAMGGYYWVHAKVAVRANTPLSEGLDDGSVNRCSIGAMVFDEVLSCPDCSAQYGRFVGFYETEIVEESNGKDVETTEQYICPHTPLNWLYLWLDEMFGDPDNPTNWSTGILRDAAIYPLELSACVHGMIGTAKLIRS